MIERIVFKKLPHVANRLDENNTAVYHNGLATDKLTIVRCEKESFST